MEHGQIVDAFAFAFAKERNEVVITSFITADYPTVEGV